MKDSRSGAQASRSYEQFKVMVDMDNSRSWAKALDAMKKLLLWMT